MAAFGVGFIFALGLGISGMTQPEKILGFLQISKDWDPSLMFVMIGAIPIHALAYRWIRGKRSPLFDVSFHIPLSNEITKHLVIGSAIFGFGWALGGFCPGPALTSVGAASPSAILFVGFMILGMFLRRLTKRKI